MRKFVRFQVIAICLLLSTIALSQNKFLVAIGDNLPTAGNCIIQNQQKQFVISGNTEYGLCITNIDSTLKINWSKKLQLNENVFTSQIIQLNNGNYIVTWDGFQVFDHRSGLILLDKGGNILSAKMLDLGISAYHIIALNGGGCIIAGTKYDDIIKNMIVDNLIIKLDDNLNIVWKKSVQGVPISNIIEDHSKNLFVIRHSTLGGAAGENIYISKLTDKGTHIWTKRFGNQYGTRLWSSSFIETTEHEYMLAGEVAGFFNSPNTDIFVAKINSDGNLLWSKRLFDYGFEYNNILIEGLDNSFILGCNDQTSNGGAYSSKIIKLNSQGNVLFSKRINEVSDIYSIIKTTDKYFFSGDVYHTRDAGQRQDILFGAIDAAGSICNATGFVTNSTDLMIPYTDDNTIITNKSWRLYDTTFTFTPYGNVFSICDETLPLKTLSFTASSNGISNLLRWSTTQEINSDHFEIERSFNSTDFKIIGVVESNNNSINKNNYQFNDSTFPKAINYYRLKIIDKDGQFVYSTIRTVNNSNSFSVNLYSNPVGSNLIFRLNSEKQTELSMIITDATGKEVYRNKFLAANGSNMKTINVSFLNKGLYYIKFLTANNQATLKFIKGD